MCMPEFSITDREIAQGRERKRRSLFPYRVDEVVSQSEHFLDESIPPPLNFNPVRVPKRLVDSHCREIIATRVQGLADPESSGVGHQDDQVVQERCGPVAELEALEEDLDLGAVISIGKQCEYHCPVLRGCFPQSIPQPPVIPALLQRVSDAVQTDHLIEN